MSALTAVSSVVNSRFCAKLPIPSSDNDDLSSHIYIVTGANTGLGKESCRHLHRLGVGKLIMAVRSESKGQEACADIISSNPQSKTAVEVWIIDMDSYDSIKAFASRVSDLPRIDGVLANAGIMTTKFSLSEGIERTLNVNVIATFLLYLLLLPKLSESRYTTGNVPRYVIPNSALHHLATGSELEIIESQSVLDRLSDPDKADMAARYNLSKLLVIYLVRAFADKQQSDCILNTPNPSFCKSNLAHEADGPAFRMFERIMARTTEEGSRVLVHALLAGPETNGQYMSDCQVESPSKIVTNEQGQRIQERLEVEVVTKLESISPGISKNLDSLSQN